MELFISKRALLGEGILVDGKPLTIAGEIYTLPESARKAIESAEIPEGMPFALEQSGVYEPHVSAWLLSLPSNGCPSGKTWSSYGRDVAVFARYLREKHNRTLLQADKEDIDAYYRARMITPAKPLDPSSWNRAVAALESFYDWALDRRLVETKPFSYKRVKSSTMHQRFGAADERNSALARTKSGLKVKCVTLDQYLSFRDIGLRGLLPDGTPDPEFRGRNSLRNAAIAETFISTGIRLSEGTWLLEGEIPDPGDPKWNGLRSCKMRLSRLTAKGMKARAVRFPKRILTEYIQPFRREDRDNNALSAKEGGLYLNVDEPILVKTWRADGCIELLPGGNTRKWFYSQLAPEKRARMYSVDENGAIIGPGMLWLSESGMGIGPGNIEKIFERACGRCAQFGIHVDITPHTLRHTFAVYMLSQLIRETIGGLSEVQRQKQSLSEKMYRHVFLDPLRELQKMMGHESYTTTFEYLTYIEEAEELVEGAVASWGERLGQIGEFLSEVARETA